MYSELVLYLIIPFSELRLRLILILNYVNARKYVHFILEIILELQLSTLSLWIFALN